LNETILPSDLAAAGPRGQGQPALVAAAPAPGGPAWDRALLIAFRFVFSYLALSSVPEDLRLTTYRGGFVDPSFSIWQPMVSWVGKHVFQLSRPLLLIFDGGSGDDTPHFVQLFCEVALALAAMLVWTLLDRRSHDHRRLHAGMRLYVRYALGSTLLGYGMLKLIKGQFMYPHVMRLAEPYGDMSPMGLLWNFMGFSTLYNLFAGAAEAGAAVLLFFRRTTTLGALLAVAAMTNVVMINFSYDVPVKQFALQLLLMGVFLLAPDLRRLADLLVLQRPTAPRNAAPRPAGPRWRRVAPLVLKAVVIGYFVISITKACLDRWLIFDRARSISEARYSRIYEVDDFVRNGRPVPPSPHGASRWRSLEFRPRGAVVTAMDHRTYAVDYDAAGQTLAVRSADRRTSLGVLACSRPDAGHLVLTGKLANDSLIVTLHSLDPKRFFLVSRGFHWIDEAPEDR
jgi:YD repeat-containing protein